MGTLRLILTIIYIIDCVFLAVVVLMQEGKSSGLGSIAGGSDGSYWGKNKGRSKEGRLAMLTKIAAVLFLVLSAVLNITRF